MGWEKGTVEGIVSEQTDDYLQVSQEGKQYAKKIWRGRQYEGDWPPLGAYGSFWFSTAPPKEGRKYGSSYLDGWEAREAPQNGSQAVSGPSEGQPERRFVGRDPGTADFWQAMRWAYSLAAEITAREGKTPTVQELSGLAGDLFSTCYRDAQFAHSEALKETEANEQA